MDFKVKESMRSTRLVYWRLRAVTLLAPMMVLGSLRRAHLIDFSMLSIAPQCGLIFLFRWSDAAATLECRRRGVSMERQVVERLARPQNVADLPPAEVRTDPAFWRRLATIFTLFSAGLALLPLLQPLYPGSQQAYSFVAGSAVVALYFWIAGAKRWGFIARADSRGVTLPGTWKFDTLEWDRFTGCCIVSQTDLFGRPFQTRCVFQVDGGKTVRRVLFQGVDRSGEEQFLHYLRTKCPALPS